MAWAWVKHLSKFHKIHLITNCEFRADLVSGIRKYSLENKVLLYFNDIGERATRMGQNQGDWRFYYYYRKWHNETYKIAKQIINTHQIDLVHQLNMIGFREPGYLWKTQVPSIWGPIGGLSQIQRNFLVDINYSLKMKYYLKNIISLLQLKYSNNVKKAFKNYTQIIAANHDSKKRLLNHLKVDVPVINETGAYSHFSTLSNQLDRYDDKTLNILWVGRDLFTKQLNLALRIIAKSRRDIRIQFHIVGLNDNGSKKYKKIAEDLKISEIIIWHGIVERMKVKTLMQKSHIFLFTSIMEGTPHVVLEAIENKLPIICFDTCGQGDCVNDEIGIKIPLENPKKAVEDFSNALLHLNNNRELLANFSRNCIKRCEELSWGSKIEIMNDHYLNAIKTFKK
ncbi:glycosyltransferase [Ulvibacterium marinum]|uniref:Glycosyltransferase n=2 Tax=Ulvibacterium marinum TaxID=2419782 RepID=A0A3B0C0Y7_9FLAO|nr:glycosyltransferase [Ulvibacterium marinum]